MNLPVEPLDLLRCPCCKGALTRGDATLACAACATGYPFVPDLACWDLRPAPRLRSDVAGGAADRAPTIEAARARDGRWWRAVRFAHAELPRQGVLLRLDLPDPTEADGSNDLFRTSLRLVSSVEVARGFRHSGSTRPDALVDSGLLPVASQRIDLLDANILGAPRADLERRLAEVHRVLAPSGHAYLTGRARWTSFGVADLAARSSFGSGVAWIPPGLGTLPGEEAAAALHRRMQAWVGFEYTLGRGIQAPRPAFLRRWLVRLRRDRELVCWRTRGAESDWKSTPSDEPMIFGRFHFPAPTPST